MSSAVAGFLGVIAGALTTGGVQYIAGWMDRRNDSLTAARLIYGALVEVEVAIGTAAERGHVPADTDFKRQIALWDAQSESLARALDVVKFHLLQAAFSNIRYADEAIDKARQEGDQDGGLQRLQGDPGHAARMKGIRDGQTIALGAGRRVIDRLTLNRQMKRAELPGADTL
jgi:hypothetical protein